MMYILNVCAAAALWYNKFFEEIVPTYGYGIPIKLILLALTFIVLKGSLFKPGAPAAQAGARLVS